MTYYGQMNAYLMTGDDLVKDWLLEYVEAWLERARANLARYKASVLQAACEGRLVSTEAELARAEYERALHYLRPATRGWVTGAHTCSALTGEGVSINGELVGELPPSPPSERE